MNLVTLVRRLWIDMSAAYRGLAKSDPNEISIAFAGFQGDLIFDSPYSGQLRKLAAESVEELERGLPRFREIHLQRDFLIHAEVATKSSESRHGRNGITRPLGPKITDW